MPMQRVTAHLEAQSQDAQRHAMHEAQFQLSPFLVRADRALHSLLTHPRPLQNWPQFCVARSPPAAGIGFILDIYPMLLPKSLSTRVFLIKNTLRFRRTGAITWGGRVRVF